MKKCSKCKVEKQDSDFYKEESKKDGLNQRCKSCERKRSLKYREHKKNKKDSNVIRGNTKDVDTNTNIKKGNTYENGKNFQDMVLDDLNNDTSYLGKKLREEYVFSSIDNIDSKYFRGGKKIRKKLSKEVSKDGFYTTIHEGSCLKGDIQIDTEEGKKVILEVKSYNKVLPNFKFPKLPNNTCYKSLKSSDFIKTSDSNIRYTLELLENKYKLEIEKKVNELKKGDTETISINKEQFIDIVSINELGLGYYVDEKISQEKVFISKYNDKKIVKCLDISKIIEDSENISLMLYKSKDEYIYLLFLHKNEIIYILSRRDNGKANCAFILNDKLKEL